MIRYKGYCHSLNGGTWSVTRNNQSKIEGHSDMTMGCVLTCSDISHGDSDVIRDVFPLNRI